MERIPQGILGAHAENGLFQLSRHEPAPRLRPFVHYYWIVRWDLRGRPPYEQRVLPNLSVHVAFSRDAAGVWPPSRDVFSYVLKDRDHALGVRMRPGCCRAVLGRSAGELAGERKPLREVLGTEADGVRDAILRAHSRREMVALADAFLTADTPAPEPAELRAADAVARIATDPSITHVQQLSTATGMSVRTLQRLFVHHVGVGPKWAIRVFRLNEAASRIRSQSVPDYAALATELGYSDQAHFTRDFKAAVGVPPATYGRPGL